MEGFGCQDTIQIGDRNFRIHTGCDTNKNKALAEVFEDGNFLFNITKSYQIRQNEDQPIDETYLKNAVYKLHQQLLDEVTLLFQINEKIGKLNLYLAHLRLGRVFMAKGFYQEAIINFKRVIQLSPNFSQAYKLLGTAYVKMNEYKNALRIFSTVLEKESEYPDILNARGVLYIHMGNYEAAKNDLQKAIKLNPDLLECNFNMGVLLFLSTIAESPNEENFVLPARIIRSIKELKNLDHYNDVNWKVEFEETLDRIENGSKNEVIQALYNLQIKMIGSSDLNVEMDLFFLRFLYGGKELSRKDINMYERIIRTGSKNYEGFADYWNDLAIMHLIQCRDSFVKAIDDFETSIKINPKYDESNDALELIKRGKKGFLILLRAVLK
ncbi:MAG: tetratricopeptide repeat protein [Calditrichaceae bacterium]